jgi:hypothetical protein
MADPVVTLGKREFPVPELVVEQMREVYPAVGQLSRFLAGGAASLLAIDTETMDLLIKTVFIGIAPGTPGFTRAEFMKLTAKPVQLIHALTVIAKQGGMIEEAPGNASGEGEAASL